MKDKKLSYIWIIPIALIFPMIQNIIFFIRFANLPAELFLQSLIFAPMGLISGALLIYLLRKDIDGKRKKGIIIGYLISVPIALLVSIVSGLIVPPIVATSVVGTIPLLIGTTLGYGVTENSKLTLIVLSIIWGIVFYPSVMMGYFSPWNMEGAPASIGLIKLAAQTLPIVIGASLIGSWVVYFKQKYRIAKIIIGLPLINILLLYILGLTS
ncbi:hypothetical protein R9X47_09625 [Wukongibacter baidiensis]|uniref:hypothetical protein n=1 Tax=Wukongibacter baidiensis TaxID=1723361 RepID=UPI003D7FD0FF